MSGQPEHSLQTAGFWVFGFLSVVLAVLKLTLAAYWSWWRVMPPLLAFLGHNALYILAGLICFRWLKHEAEESTTAEKYSREGYTKMVAVGAFYTKGSALETNIALLINQNISFSPNCGHGSFLAKNPAFSAAIRESAVSSRFW